MKNIIIIILILILFEMACVSTTSLYVSKRNDVSDYTNYDKKEITKKKEMKHLNKLLQENKSLQLKGGLRKYYFDTYPKHVFSRLMDTVVPFEPKAYSTSSEIKIPPYPYLSPSYIFIFNHKYRSDSLYFYRGEISILLHKKKVWLMNYRLNAKIENFIQKFDIGNQPTSK